MLIYSTIDRFLEIKGEKNKYSNLTLMFFYHKATIVLGHAVLENSNIDWLPNKKF